MVSDTQLVCRAAVSEGRSCAPWNRHYFAHLCLWVSAPCVWQWPPAVLGEGNEPSSEQGFTLKRILITTGTWWAVACRSEGWSGAGCEVLSHGVLLLCRWWTRCLEGRCTRRAFGRMECSALPWTTPAHSSGAQTFPVLAAVSVWERVSGGEEGY